MVLICLQQTEPRLSKTKSSDEDSVHLPVPGTVLSIQYLI